MTFAPRAFLHSACIFLALALTAQGAAVNATWTTATDVPVSASSYTATGNTVNLTLNFAPPTGTNLTVVNNTGLPFISGTFDNLAQGQGVNLSYNGVTYPFVANYYGGTGNDLVLVWAGNRPVAWGSNYAGKLGNGTTTSSSTPVAVSTAGTPLAGRTLLAFAAGFQHSLAVCADGSLVSWGANNAGQLGNGTTTNSSVPQAVPTAGTPLEGKTVVAVSAGFFNSVALCSDGTLATWGADASTSSMTPVAVPTAGTPLEGRSVVAIATSGYLYLALCSDGTLAAWGSNTNGELGNGTTTNSSVPVAVTTAGTPLQGKTVVSIAVGAGFNLALCADGTLVAWGYNANGQLGNGTTTSSSVPVAVTTVGTPLEGKTVIAVAAGVSHSLALCSDGTVAAWGYNYYGQLGNNSTYDSSVPVAVVSSGVLAGKTIIGLNAGYSQSLARCTDGTQAAWGQNTTSQSNIPVAVDTSSLAPAESIVLVASGTYATHTLGLVASPIPAAATWNTATDVPVSASSYTATGSTVEFTLNFAPVSGTTLTVVNNTGLAFISGTFDNLAHGQAVNLSYNGITYPFVASYYGGTGNDLVLVWANTRPVAWGYNYYGQLGNNTMTNSSFPTAVTRVLTPLVGRTLLALSAGYQYSLALCSDGSLSSWGYNGFGQLGNNTTTDSSVPVAVTTAGTPLAGKVVVAVSAGYSHNLVLCSDGTLASWGSNGSGQLGNSTYTSSSVPVAVTTTGTPLAGKTVVSIAVGAGHSIVLCSDGTLAAWGYNNYGQLGNNTTTNSSVPVAVTTAGTPLAGKTVVSIAAGTYHNVALCSDGTVVTWGYNYYGQLGNNTTTNSSVPVAVTMASTPLAGRTVVAVAAGANHSLALCSDGILVAWGYNYYGQLGNSTTTQSTVPVAVSTSGVLAGKTVVGVSAGFGQSLAWCKDGTLAAWGYNWDGELGNGSTTSSSSPVAVSTSPLATGESFMRVTTGPNASHTLGLVAMPIPVAMTQTATTLAATSVTATSVVLNGVVNANYGIAAVSFDYGLDSSYGTNVAGTPAYVAGGSDTSVSTTLSGLVPGTTYHFRANGGIANGADLTFTTLSLLQSWRLASFGTTASSGTLADDADYDGDGIPNLVEYALNLSPTTASRLPVTTAVNGANFEYTYSRSTAAVSAGTAFVVEWSGVLPATWSSSGVTQTVLSDDGTTQQVKAVIPANAATTMFARLSVTAPP